VGPSALRTAPDIFFAFFSSSPSGEVNCLTLISLSGSMQALRTDARLSSPRSCSVDIKQQLRVEASRRRARSSGEPPATA
jgi:hypothetical protein